ncbi:CaiB/BaiF CoA transferase family protein [Salinisphaera orenii]|nr:CaiB/BaiF CoA-transferase family protein [Salinisphaera orenii]
MGPLEGLRVLEIEGLGPAPFCGMMLADMGATVISVTRPSKADGNDGDRPASERGKASIAIDIKTSEGVEILLSLADGCDALIEGFRPGVAERLGFGPEICHERNPRLVYGRMTGWGQTGPLAGAAGHDINYIALSGALHAMGRAGERPVPPLNLVGDFGGGGMMLAFGVMCALWEVARSGQGQVVDAAMTDGSAALMGMIYDMRRRGRWADERGTNLLDGGAPFYDTYKTRDGRHVAIGAIEPQFYALLLEKTGLQEELGARQSSSDWPAMRRALARVFRQKTRDEWCEIMEGTDVCFAPVLAMDEAPAHPHNVARGTFLTQERGAAPAPAPAPKLSRTRPEVAFPARAAGADTRDLLRELGYGQAERDALYASGVVAG